MEIFLSILLGTSFGIALDQAGASDPQKITGMLRLKNFHLMKVILFAIGFSSLILFILLSIDVISAEHLSVKKTYAGVLIGGAILGIGFALGGYCPGTSVVAAGRGRKDAFFFILGGLLGSLVYMLIFSFIMDSAIFNNFAGGRVSIAETNPEKYTSLGGKLPALLVAGPIAIILMLISIFLPNEK